MGTEDGHKMTAAEQVRLFAPLLYPPSSGLAAHDRCSHCAHRHTEAVRLCQKVVNANLLRQSLPACPTAVAANACNTLSHDPSLPRVSAVMRSLSLSVYRRAAHAAGEALIMANLNAANSHSMPVYALSRRLPRR